MDHFDVIETVFSAAEDLNLIEVHSAEFSAVLEELADCITADQFHALDGAVAAKVRAAMMAGFKVGWALRGKV